MFCMNVFLWSGTIFIFQKTEQNRYQKDKTERQQWRRRGGRAGRVSNKLLSLFLCNLSSSLMHSVKIPLVYKMKAMPTYYCLYFTTFTEAPTPTPCCLALPLPLYLTCLAAYYPLFFPCLPLPPCPAMPPPAPMPPSYLTLLQMEDV